MCRWNAWYGQPLAIGAVERAVGFIEATAQARGIEHAVQMTLGFSDGERLWAVRYLTERRSRRRRCSSCSRAPMSGSTSGRGRPRPRR